MGENEAIRSSRACSISAARVSTRLRVASVFHSPGPRASPLATSDWPEAVVNSTSTLSAAAGGAARIARRNGSANICPLYFNMAAIMSEPLWGVNRFAVLSIQCVLEAGQFRDIAGKKGRVGVS
jgi:hypothetical protein